ncbi:predicted protein [Lichtheimia corymbifera JMRC:FSU:9682]|uniref:Uncharacterized protein n=1 Tax=Lichtheimia corymbifera JMRC:FSU:9682 TaxID=1263082 RepID=A0A068RWI0_9FUNG|nr:predicted protein [Lichtheimia corymbifera JMRC:FSU:9682]
MDLKARTLHVGSMHILDWMDTRLFGAQIILGIPQGCGKFSFGDITSITAARQGIQCSVPSRIDDPIVLVEWV